MCISPRPIAAALFLGFLTPLWAADPLVAVMPEKSSIFINVGNLTKLRAAKSHPLFKALNEGEIGKALKPALDKLAGEADAETAAILKEETGLSLEELLAKFSGEAAASFSMALDKIMGGDMTKPDTENMNVIFAADFNGDEALMAKVISAVDKLGEKSAAARKAKAAESKAAAADDEDEDEEEEEEAADEKNDPNWPEDYEETVTEVGGAKVHEWKVTDTDKNRPEYLAWSVANGKAVLSIGKTDLKEVVARITKPTDAGSLASSTAWKSIPDSARESDTLMGINLESVLGDVQESLRLKMEKGELDTGGLPINPLQAWTGAGLDKLQAAFIATDLDTEDAAMHAGLTYSDKPALLKVYAAKGPGTPPAFVPAGVQEVSWGTFDWGGFYDNLRDLAIAVSPMAAGGIEMGTTELKKKIGVDLRKDILGQMGDDLWSVSHMDPPAADVDDKKEKDSDASVTNPLAAFSAMTEGQAQVVGIALRDAKAFSISLKSIFNTVAPDKGLFEERKFENLTINEVKGMPVATPIAWLIHNETLIFSVGKPDLMEKVLRGMAKAPAEPLIAQPHVKAAFAKLPDGGVSSGYADAGRMIDVLFGTLKPLLAEQAEGDAADVIEGLPDQLNLPWYVVSRAYLGEKAAEVQLRLMSKP